MLRVAAVYLWDVDTITQTNAAAAAGQLYSAIDASRTEKSALLLLDALPYTGLLRH